MNKVEITTKNVKDSIANTLRLEAYCTVQGILDSIRFLEITESKEHRFYHFVITIFDTKCKEMLDSAFNGTKVRLLTIEDEISRFVLRVGCAK